METSIDLFVVRHAIAYDADLERWPDDCDRPLTRKGERAFRSAARGLGRITKSVPVVLSSPCERALRTAEMLAEHAKWGDPERLEELRPEVDAATALAALAARDPSERLAVVGHEPMLSELCGLLSGGGVVELKKGAVARLSVRELAAGGGTLRWILPPKVLRGLRR